MYSAIVKIDIKSDRGFNTVQLNLQKLEYFYMQKYHTLSKIERLKLLKGRSPEARSLISALGYLQSFGGKDPHKITDAIRDKQMHFNFDFHEKSGGIITINIQSEDKDKVEELIQNTAGQKQQAVFDKTGRVEVWRSWQED